MLRMQGRESEDGGRVTQLWSAGEGWSGEYHLSEMKSCGKNCRKCEDFTRHVAAVLRVTVWPQQLTLEWSL